MKNYILEIRSFYNELEVKPISTGQIALWYALMYLNNLNGWSEWFNVANSKLEFYSGLSRSGIQKARNSLKQLGFIDFKPNGKKATAYKLISLYTLNSNQDSVQDSNHFSNQDSVQDSVQDSGTYNNKHKQKLKLKQKEKRNIKEKEHSSGIYDDIVAYLNQKTGRNYRTGIEKTKALITARLNEGFEYADFCKVIDNKTADWLNNADMSKYLRPETLFGNKFESYLNQGGLSNEHFNQGQAPKYGDVY